MLDIYKAFATDSQAEIEGVWQDIGSGARILVARAGNRAYGRLLSKLAKQNREALDRDDDAADDLSLNLMIQAMASTVLLNWDGISFKGSPLAYSVENAVKLLSIGDFRALVSEKAGTVDNYRAKDIDAQGNA